MALADACFEKAGRDLLLHLGEPATYVFGSGAPPVEVTAVVSRGRDLEDARWNAAVQASAELMVRESDLGKAPEYQDTVIIAGETWTVAQKIEKAGSMWRLEIRRDLRPTFRKR